MSIKSINSSQAESLIKNNKDLVILDVRRPNEFKESRIVNSINIPVEEIEWEIDELEKYKDKPILVYCKVGVRSSVACAFLEEEGFTNLYNLRGGILDFNGEIE
ncbi:rhodanese-like domain-containing protein [Clostridium sp. Sa3CUN1]|uniref:Rhodanese-like domain-containing protein n=1 Tax=Clostridium gallinarum TaxID=2762246 RepID=A0ABR8Q6U9_9CLOT|nr:rhodanese-like domain-containing protein [Clostridium gallinarum]MBD7916152.1 rhodanese-like domain-containing protein [Clostridium gallinarum]